MDRTRHHGRVHGRAPDRRRTRADGPQPHARARGGAGGARCARAETPAEAARGAELVCICVADSPDVEAVVLGPGGVAEGIASGAVVLDCSTIAPDTARRVASELASRGAGAVDAPVSGGSEGARKGQLTAFVGGEDDARRDRPAGARGVLQVDHAPRRARRRTGRQGGQPGAHLGHLRGARRGAGARRERRACRSRRSSRRSAAAPRARGSSRTAPPT